MIDKPPPDGIPAEIAEMLTWAWVLFLSLLGGVASFTRRLERRHPRVWNFTELVGEITAAGLTGIITANLCDSMGTSSSLKYALVGISAHMGSRALFKLEALVNAKFNLPPDSSKGNDDAA